MISDLALLRRAGLLAVLAASLSACNLAARLGDVGSAPELTPIVNPVQAPNYQRVSLPMPRSEPAPRRPNSLWRPGARAFFKDQRAALVGDILTINIAIADEATIRNRTTRSRNNSESAELTGIFGYEGSLAQVLPEAVNPGNLVDLGSQSSSSGNGQVDRGEEINLTIAALVTQVLPNGNLVISGSQEVRVNFEVRRLSVSGVVRPEDISASNTVIIGFAWGGWVTGGTAQRMAEESAQTAVVDRLSPICVEQFNQDSEKDQKLKELKETNSWERDDYIEKQGWATMPGEKEADRKVAGKCAELLVELGQ